MTSNQSSQSNTSNPQVHGSTLSAQENANRQPSNAPVSLQETDDGFDENISTALNSESHPSTQPKSKIRRRYDWEGSWAWEIGGASLSAVGIALLIGFLGYVDGMAYPRWQYSVSPNAVISVISAFAKACTLIPVSSCLGQLKWNGTWTRQPAAKPLHHFQVLDDASRGPWGSLSVFWNIGSPLAIAGAILTILSVTLDPFAQQILAFPSRNVVHNGATAYVQRMVNYYPFWSNETTGYIEYVIDPSLETALLTGLSRINTPLEPVCPTAYCDYPDFSTLGICCPVMM